MWAPKNYILSSKMSTNSYIPTVKYNTFNKYSRKIKLKQATFTGGTDSRFLRELGIPAIGFSPMSCTTPALHEHNESISARTFLHGIGLYETIIPAVANV